MGSQKLPAGCSPATGEVSTHKLLADLSRSQVAFPFRRRLGCALGTCLAWLCAGTGLAAAAGTRWPGSRHSPPGGRWGLWQLPSLPSWISEPSDTRSRSVLQPLSSQEGQIGWKGICPLVPAVPLCLAGMRACWRAGSRNPPPPPPPSPSSMDQGGTSPPHTVPSSPLMMPPDGSADMRPVHTTPGTVGTVAGLSPCQLLDGQTGPWLPHLAGVSPRPAFAGEQRPRHCHHPQHQRLAVPSTPWARRGPARQAAMSQVAEL